LLSPYGRDRFLLPYECGLPISIGWRRIQAFGDGNDPSTKFWCKWLFQRCTVPGKEIGIRQLYPPVERDDESACSRRRGRDAHAIRHLYRGIVGSKPSGPSSTECKKTYRAFRSLAIECRRPCPRTGPSRAAREGNSTCSRRSRVLHRPLRSGL